MTFFQPFFTMLAETPVLFPSGDSGAAAVDGAAAGANGAVQATGTGGGFFGDFTIVTVLLYVAVFAALYFFLIRPQRKREKTVREMQAALKAGDNVVTTSGLYGTIVSIGEDCFIVEFGMNKGVRVPVRKLDIAAVKSPAITPGKEVADETK